jgi:DNA-binding NarL/FixJ family response regulator
MIDVVIADDHHLVRQGIRALLDRADDICVVGEASTGEDALDLVEELSPDVLVMDITMPGMNGVEATRELMQRGTRTSVVMLSMHSDVALIRQAVQAGATGYVLKGSVADELLLAVRAASTGGTYLTKAASEQVMNGRATRPEADTAEASATLTPREQEVLSLIGRGLTNRAIGARLEISVKTVERHRSNLMSKLDAHSVVELVRIGIKSGVIRLD